MNLYFQKSKNMLSSIKIQGEKGKNLQLIPWSFREKICKSLGIFKSSIQKPKNIPSCTKTLGVVAGISKLLSIHPYHRRADIR